MSTKASRMSTPDSGILKSRGSTPQQPSGRVGTPSSAGYGSMPGSGRSTPVMKSGVTFSKAKKSRSPDSRPSSRSGGRPLSRQVSNASLSGDDDRPGTPERRRSTNKKNAITVSTGYLPKGTQPFAMLGSLQDRHQHPKRMPCRELNEVVNMSLLDRSMDSFEHLQHVSPRVKRLEMRNLKLQAITEDLMEGLIILQKLDIGNNCLNENSLPEAFKDLLELRELRIDHNHFTKIPTVLKTLKNLSRFSFMGNKLVSVRGIEKWRRLTQLIGDNNKLEGVFPELKVLRRLEVCSLRNNLIRDIPMEIKNLKYLKEIDLSNNKLKTLPPEIFVLPHLDSLNASGNLIDRLPSINVRRAPKRKIGIIELSDNKISKFPEHLLLLSSSLDLAANNIKTIHDKVFRKISYHMTEQNLILDDNPLESPPLEVCECGLKSMLQYFKEVRNDTIRYQGLKVSVIGSFKAGKTSMIQSLLDGQGRVENSADRTVGIDVFDFSLDVKLEEEKLENMDDKEQTTVENITQDNNKVQKIEIKRNVETKPDLKSKNDNNDKVEKANEPVEGDKIVPLDLSIWDFSGHPFYKFTHYYFLDPDSLVFIVFNIAEYKNNNFYEAIGQWIDWLIVKATHLKIILVGTQSDKFKGDDLRETCNEIRSLVEKYIDKHLDQIHQDVEEIEAKQTISPALTEQYKLYRELLKLKRDIYPEVLPISSRNMDGFDQLTDALKIMGTNKDMFPFVLREIPTLWTNVEYFAEEYGEEMQIPLLSWVDFKEIAGNKCGLRHLISLISAYLNRTGKILYAPDKPMFCDHVCLRASFLPEVLGYLLRPDAIEAWDINQDEFKSSGISVDVFLQSKVEAINEGVFDEEFIKCVLTPAVVTNDSTTTDLFKHITRYFELGYDIGKKTKTGNWILSPGMAIPNDDATEEENQKTGAPKRKKSKSKKEAEKVSQSNKTLIPWLRNIEMSDELNDDWAGVESNVGICSVFRFKRLVPSGFFERLTVRFHSPSNSLKYLGQWKDGVIARSTEKPFAFLLLREILDSGGCDIRLEIRHLDVPMGGDTDEDEKKALEMLWSSQMQFIRNIEKLLEQFPGAYFQRQMECPNCREAEFLGEWLTPKELQAQETKPCPQCGIDVNTSYLVQPREKRGSELIKLKRERSRLRQEEAELERQKSDLVLDEENETKKDDKATTKSYHPGNENEIHPAVEGSGKGDHSEINNIEDDDVDKKYPVFEEDDRKQEEENTKGIGGKTEKSESKEAKCRRQKKKPPSLKLELVPAKDVQREKQKEANDAKETDEKNKKRKKRNSIVTDPHLKTSYDDAKIFYKQ